MSDWISWIKEQSSEIVDTVKNETAVLSGSLVESVKEIADQASKAVESMANEDDQQQTESEVAEKDVPLIERLDLIAADTEDYIDSVTKNMTSKIGNFLAKAITIIPDKPEITLVSDRRSNLLLEMQKDPDTYSTDYSFVVDEAEVNRFLEFSEAFSVMDRKREIDILLEEAGVIKDFFKRMVPEPLDYDTFWMRYFFKVSEIDFQENARSLALKVNQGDVIWDDSDEDSPKDIVDKSIREQAAGKNDSKEDGDSKSVIGTSIEQKNDAKESAMESVENVDIPPQDPSEDTEKKKDAKESALESIENIDIPPQNAELDPSENNNVSVERDVESLNQESQSAIAAEDEIPLDEKKGAPLEVPVKEILEDSFDVIRKESIQALEIPEKYKDLTSDDDWGGWDDSPDSPTIK